MINVVFVGDRPSKTNVVKDVAFVGAKCFARLVDWIKALEPDFYLCYNVYAPDGEPSRYDMEIVTELHEAGFKIIALGKNASAALLDQGLPHYEIPHPSGKNLKVNDPKLLDQYIECARYYIRN